MSALITLTVDGVLGKPGTHVWVDDPTQTPGSRIDNPIKLTVDGALGKTGTRVWVNNPPTET